MLVRKPGEFTVPTDLVVVQNQKNKEQQKLQPIFDYDYKKKSNVSFRYKYGLNDFQAEKILKNYAGPMRSIV